MQTTGDPVTDSNPGSIRVLVVDDDSGVREMILYALKKRGWYVQGAEDGLQALRRLQDEEFTVVVTDFQMPRMDGLALLREVRRTKRALPVVVQTTLLDRTQEEMIKQAGAFRVLMKGGPLERLVQSVKEASMASENSPA
jgi:CheY-like chemotaxis protein